MPDRILVTGHTGKIGKQIIESLMGYEVLGVSLSSGHDLRNADVVRNVYENFQPDIVLHMASPTSVSEFEDNHLNIYDSTKILLNMLEFAKPGTRFFFTSTVLVYGNTPVAVDESGNNTAPKSIYGCTKKYHEELVLSFFRRKEIWPCILRLAHVVGPDIEGGVVYDIINKVCNDDTDKIQLFGDKRGSVRPYIHIEDVCGVINFLLKAKRISHVYNVSSTGHSISIKTIANICMQIFNVDKEIEWLGFSDFDEELIMVSPRRLINHGYKMKYSSTAAVTKTIEEVRCRRIS